MFSAKILLIIGAVLLIVVVFAFVILNRITRLTPSIVRPTDSVDAAWANVMTAASPSAEREALETFVHSARETKTEYAVSVYLEKSDTPLPEELGSPTWANQTEPLLVAVTWKGRMYEPSRWKPLENAHIDILSSQR